jgi:phosphopentomutase
MSIVGRRRAVCLILDGCGVGDLAGGAGPPNTLDSIERVAGRPCLPALDSLGLGAVRAMARSAHVERASSDGPAPGGAGRARTAYAGADTYLGHQELMGTIPGAPLRSTLDELGDGLVRALAGQGVHAHWTPAGDGRVLTVGDVVIHDNIEAARGVNINVTASLDEVDFDEVLAIGQAVRQATKVARVIAVGGRGYRRADVLAHVRRHDQGHIGVDTPTLGVYDANYRVRHLGYPVDASKQAPSLAKQAGLRVALLGKAADVVSCPSPDLIDPVIDTDSVFDKTMEALEAFTCGLIVVNVQETDLAGHEQDPARYRRVLERVDERLAALLGRLTSDDLLIVSADHGNDPDIGSSQHTREFVPVLVHGPDAGRRHVDTRDTLADVAATLCDWLSLPQPQDGTAILPAAVT